ncbi:uncharacterized protein LY79DRAFT_670556 [Colletotrichum navitas]|uniref:RING-type domain-containing protein n=1 Tax=Colletotrichum navitas TaxID=681940 RepID=A0AAD8V3P8_9PEZI|nr:uncharacterized protein LY79DRAFT_670556 [Colletotrichum navitas]KAK1586118.1 hypothetical protein LY79DRAFT_670556 [Colletotrichum navitas]
MAARANYPRDSMVKLGDAWRLARVYHATFTTVLDERLRPGMQYHVHESFVYCAHPYHGPCRTDYGLVCQLAEGECPACVHDKGLPRKITARREVMDGVLPLLTGEFLKPSQAVFEYVAQLAVLAKHMVARKVPNVVLRGAMVEQLVKEVRAEVFCRSFDAHWVGPGVADCGCFSEDYGYCGNLGRFLRQQEACRILDFHRDIVLPYVNVPDPDGDDWELVLAREMIAEWFVDRRAARFDKVAICHFETNPREDQRYHDCLQRLEAAVVKYADLLRFALGPGRGGPDRTAERNLRARAVFLRKPLQWIAYDTGLADGLVEEISEVVIHWYLRVGTALSPPVDNAAWSAPLQLRRDVDATRRDMQATMERLDGVFSTGDRAGWRLFRDRFQRPPTHEEMEVHALRRARAELTAAAEARLAHAQAAADESVISVAAARGLRPPGNGGPNDNDNRNGDDDDDDDDRECPVCGSRFADDPTARRPVVVCARRHLVCRECTVTHVLSTSAHLLEHDREKLARCPMCRGSMAGFYRVNPDPADALRSPRVPDEAAAAPVVWS